MSAALATLSAAPSDLIVDASGVSAVWLTTALRSAGALVDGEVRSVEALPPWSMAVSTMTRLKVEYTPGASGASGASGSAPERLFLKTPHPTLKSEMAFRLGEREVRFYRDVAPAMADVRGLPLIRCYSAVADAGSGRWHVLLDDHSATHTQTEWPVPASLDGCRQAIDALAALHAHWWGKDPTTADDAPLPWELALKQGPDRLEQLAAQRREELDAYVAFLGDRLSPRRREIYAAAMAALPALWRWRLGAGPRTVVHGDAHVWNFLFPREAGAGPVYPCDWQTWFVDEPTRDVAYMVGLHWFPERRALHELELVRHYHARLEAEGVEGYGWDACWDDYRYSVINLLFAPMIQWKHGLSAAIWWPHLDRIMCAFEDLGCADLFTR